MKRIYTTVALLGALVTGAFAQRHCDVEVILASPASFETGDTLQLNCSSTDSITERVYVINNGPDKLYPTDTVLIGSPATTGFSYFYAAYGDTTNAGDTVAILNRKMAPSQVKWLTQIDEDNQFVEVLKADFVNDSYYLWLNLAQISGYVVTNTDVEDTVANEQGVALVHYTCSGTDIKDATKSNSTLSVYPNPASLEIRFKYNFTSAGLAVARIMDISGRTILTKDFGKMTEGEKELTLDVSSLNNGIYYVELVNGESRAINKVTIQK